MELSALHDAAMNGMADQIMAITEKWWNTANKNLAGMSEKAQKLSLLLSQHSGGMHESYVDMFRKSFSIILGEEVVESLTPKFVKGMAVIPTGNTNGHNYEKGEVAVCYSGSIFYSITNKYGVGNNMEPNIGNLAMPSREQVIKWLEKYEANHIDYFSKLMETLNLEESIEEEDNE